MEQKSAAKNLISQSRKVTIQMAGRGKVLLVLSCGFCACFYDVDGKTAWHAVLAIIQLEQPHTSEAIADALATCLQEWSIGESTVSSYRQRC